MTAIIENFRWCLGNEFWETTYASESTGETYNTRFSRGDWTCNCKGFQFRENCKHVKAAEMERCTYGWGAAAGSPEHFETNTCPKCKGPTTIVRVAV